MPTASPIRIVHAKVGLDGHDRGIKVVARALRDAGMEVIYAGLWQTPEAVVRTVADEDADWLGLSLLSGAHMTLVPRVLELLRQAGLDKVHVLVGGIVPEADIAKLEKMGVSPRNYSQSQNFGVTGVAMDAQNGDVLAVLNWPSGLIWEDDKRHKALASAAQQVFSELAKAICEE